MHSYSEYNSRSSSGMRGGRNNIIMSNSQHNAGNGNGSGMVHNNNNNRSRSRSRSVSRSRSRSLSRRQSCGQSSLSAHIQQQMERPRRGERDPTPLSRSAHNASAPNLNYNGQPPPPPPTPSTLPSPPRRTPARTPRRTSKNNNMNPPNNVASSSPSSSEERAAIAANLAKNSFSAHRNLQQLIDEERKREYNRMEHTQHQQQQMQVYNPQQEHHHPVVYPPSQTSSVAAVHQQPQHHRTPVNLMVGHESFNRSGSAMSALTSSTMTPLTPSTLGSNSTTSPDVGRGYTPQQIERGVTAMTPGRNGNSGYNHHPQQQQQQQNPPQQQQHRRSASPRKQPRDHLNKGTPRPPDVDEEQLNTIVTEHPDPELAQSIAKIMAFHKRNSTPCPLRQEQSNNRSLSQSKQIVSYDAKNAAQQQQRRSKSQLLMDVMDTNDSSEMKNRSFHSNSTAPTTASSLNSGSLFATSEPSNNNSSSSKTSPLDNSKHSQLQRQHSSSIRYLDKETLHNHLQHAPRESRVQLTRLVEKLQSENQRLNEINLTQVNQIDTLETEVGDLLRELLRYRREFGEMESVALGGGSDGDVSSEHATAPPPTVASSPFQKRHASSSRVEMNRQDSTANSNEEEEQLDVVRLYVKSKSLHEEAIDRPRRATASKRRLSSMALQNSITSAPVASFDHNINMLKQLQLGDDSPRRCSDSQNTDASFHTAAASFHTAEESIFETKDTAKQRSFKEEKKADAYATSRWRRVSAINNEADDPQSDGEGSIDEEQLLQMQQQQEHENNHQDEASREARLKSNSLEDIFEPQNRRSCFVEQKGGNTSSGSVPSMTDTVGSCSWSCSSPESGGK
mmetsp:Transcript_20491/g.40893  ORF Transcript_20491/g.40893 Transcript_20491/m.40893 type:complete len:846 (+) Transcript_20491:129-2666(+)